MNKPGSPTNQPTNQEVLNENQRNYQERYAKQQAFLRYPADWVIRFHNLYLKQHVPSGRVLDFGCGSGNNSVFFMEQGYETYGVEVADAVLPMIRANLQSKHLDMELAQRFSIIQPDCSMLPYEDGFFDVIVSNQVLYYLSSEEHIKRVCRELSRCLRRGGVVFFTMMGPGNYYVTHHAKAIHGGQVYEIALDSGHRLAGLRQFIYVVRDEDELKGLFCEFECLSVGYFDQRMFDLKSNFHWIFIGRKTPVVLKESSK